MSVDESSVAGSTSDTANAHAGNDGAKLDSVSTVNTQDRCPPLQ